MFDAAHYIPYHEGKCKGIHGHTYYVRNLKIWIPESFIDWEKGMIVDFGKVKDYFDEEWDHKFIVPIDDADSWLAILTGLGLRRNIVALDYTTAEWMAAEIHKDLFSLVIDECYDGELPEDENNMPIITFELYEGPNQGVVIDEG